MECPGTVAEARRLLVEAAPAGDSAAVRAIWWGEVKSSGDERTWDRGQERGGEGIGQTRGEERKENREGEEPKEAQKLSSCTVCGGGSVVVAGH